MPTLLFCAPFHHCISRSPTAQPLCHHARRVRRQPATKRRIRHPCMKENEIPGGPAPDFSEDPGPPVEYYDLSSAPDPAPLLPEQRELPLFPLRMVLNPGTPLPLHIFELRYRLLFNRIRDSDSRFGIVMYNPDSSSLASIGCAAELTRFEPLPDGRIMTNNIGRERFRILRIIEEKPYTRAVVEHVYDETPDEDLSALMEDVWGVLQDVLRLSNKLYDKVLDLSPEIRRLAPGGDADLESAETRTKDGWPSPRRLEDFSFAVCQVLDMPIEEQQILLQIRNTGKRLRRQNKMLQTARQYLAAQVTIKNAGLKDF